MPGKPLRGPSAGARRLAPGSCQGDTRGVPERNVAVCDICGKERPTWSVTKCSMCGQLACHKCATVQYGRYFCSKRCGLFFFHGEGLEDDENGES